MGGELPGAFIADGINSVDNVVRKAAFVFDAFGENKRAKSLAFGE